ncbi:gamma carbonic anhydrase family protein [bacterium]|nr:gamma carbonic anhydrase family protein [bacterium]
MIRPFKGVSPDIAGSAYVDESAVIEGQVTIGEESSIWCGAVLRGDVNRIVVGARTNVQDNAVLHVRRRAPLIIGDEVTIGHLAHLHACVVSARCLIGSGSILLDECEIGEGAVIAAGALISPGVKVPPRTLMMGVPAKPRRPITDEEFQEILYSSQNYVRYAREHKTP